MTLIILFDSIFKCGDNMNTEYSNKQKQKVMFLKAKKLYMNKKYSAFDKVATKYLEKYPNDVIVRFMRAKSYRALKYFDEAISDLKYNLNIDDSNYSLTELFFLYYHLNRYEEALEIITDVYKRKCINCHSLLITEIIMKKQLGKKLNIKIGLDSNYITRQVYDYNMDMALEHIKNHHIENNENICFFDKNIDLDYLFNLVKYNIKNENKVNTEEILEIHYIGISNVGYIKNDICNYIKVVVIPNTTDILNMYPTNNIDCDYVYNIECDYDKLFSKKEEKVKKMTQIDKFNKKYKRV